jgi:hypothetical protein
MNMGMDSYHFVNETIKTALDVTSAPDYENHIVQHMRSVVQSEYTWLPKSDNYKPEKLPEIRRRRETSPPGLLSYKDSLHEHWQDQSLFYGSPYCQAYRDVDLPCKCTQENQARYHALRLEKIRIHRTMYPHLHDVPEEDPLLKDYNSTDFDRHSHVNPDGTDIVVHSKAKIGPYKRKLRSLQERKERTSMPTVIHNIGRLIWKRQNGINSQGNYKPFPKELEEKVPSVYIKGGKILKVGSNQEVGKQNKVDPDKGTLNPCYPTPDWNHEEKECVGKVALEFMQDIITAVVTYQRRMPGPRQAARFVATTILMILFLLPLAMGNHIPKSVHQGDFLYESIAEATLNPAVMQLQKEIQPDFFVKSRNLVLHIADNITTQCLAREKNILDPQQFYKQDIINTTLNDVPEAWSRQCGAQGKSLLQLGTPESREKYILFAKKHQLQAAIAGVKVNEHTGQPAFLGSIGKELPHGTFIQVYDKTGTGRKHLSFGD